MIQELVVCSDPENCTPGCFDEIEYNYDDFQGFQKSIKKSVDDLKIIETGLHGSFYNVILLRIFSKLEENSHVVLEEKKNIENVLRKCFYDKLNGKKEIIFQDLNLAKFQRHCHKINDLLNEKRCFLRVYEFQNKFRYIIKKET